MREPIFDETFSSFLARQVAHWTKLPEAEQQALRQHLVWLERAKPQERQLVYDTTKAIVYKEPK